MWLQKQHFCNNVESYEILALKESSMVGVERAIKRST